MSKTLENILLNSITEVYDGIGDSMIYSPQYIKKLSSVMVVVDDNNGIDVVDSLYQELIYFMHHEEDEIDIHYDNGQQITLDNYVVKHLIASISSEEIDKAGLDIEYMHQIIIKSFDEVIHIEEE